jgi:protoheme IX farnesyltransferase
MKEMRKQQRRIIAEKGSPQIIAAALQAKPPERGASVRHTLMALFKVRIVFLLLFAAVGGAFLGAGGWPGAGTLTILIITGGLAAGGASALNEYLEQERDALMQRTRQRRPLVNGAIGQPGWVPYLASGMILIPSLAVLPFNPALSFFLLLGAIIYIGVYTLWLKPRSVLNIVIGGAAGSAAVLSGSAAAGAWNDPGALILAFLVFFWTPTHFWSLAIVYRDDYARGGFPMLPVQIPPRQAAAWVMVHTVPTVGAALMLTSHASLSWIYLIPVALASADLVLQNIRLLMTPTAKGSFSLFKISNLYLALVLLMICVDVLV